MLVLPNITCSNITCQTALFPLAASQQHSKPCGRPAPTMSTKLRYSANSRRNSASCSAVGAGTPEDPDKIPNVALGSESETAPGQEPLKAEDQREPSFGARLKRFFGGDKMDRERLKALGVGAVLSYGFVSNVTYGGGMAVSWIAFLKQKGLSPLMPGQWKAFLAFYAGFWTLQNFVRPLRFALAVSLAPVFDGIINSIQRITGGSRQKAFAVSLVLLGTITASLVFGSIFIFAGPMAFSTKAPLLR